MEFIQTPPKIYLLELREKLFSLMQESEYADNSINTFRKIFNLLETFFSEKGYDYYDITIGKEFMCSCKKYRGKIVNGKRIMTDTVLTFVTCLNNILLFNQLKTPTAEKTFYCPDCFKATYDEYIQSLRNKNLTSETIENHSRYVSAFLTDFSSIADSFDKLDFNFIQSYLKTKTFNENVFYCISSFFRFLYSSGLTKINYAYDIHPAVVEKRLPSVYSKEEIGKMLSCIDKKTVNGKRDYAIILLAYRLGLRVSDICSLKFSNVDFINNKISIVQKKTHVPLNLPLLPEVKNAFEDYIAVRPNSPHEEIFLRSRAPFEPLKRGSSSTQLEKYFNKSDIDGDFRKRGLHSLRSTLATELVSENVSYAVTQKILGHLDSSAIQHYVRLDVEALRTCSISVPSPTGNFQKILFEEVKENG